jgi:peptide chain release factor 1
VDWTPHFERKRLRLAEVEEHLAVGDVFSDARRAEALTREHSRLKSDLGTFDAWCQARRELADTAALRLQTDPNDAAMMELIAADTAALETKLASLELQVQAALLPPDPNEERNILLEIRAGTGGSEAGLFAGDLYRMYSRFIESSGWRSEVLEVSPSELGGVREIILLVTGDGVYRAFQFESGVHRVQRVPATEAQGRIHTSAATVAVMPEAREVDIEIKPEELRIEVTRSGGPGGQGVNTTDSAVQILHIPTGTIVRCQDSRSQIKNRERALSILRSRLLERRQAEADAALAAQRKSQVGSGDRNEKIRTYNFPQNRVTDHRINFTLYDLNNVIEGHLGPLLEALRRHDIQAKLQMLEESRPT